jgi:hypothetical protein
MYREPNNDENETKGPTKFKTQKERNFFMHKKPQQHIEG